MVIVAYMAIIAYIVIIAMIASILLFAYIVIIAYLVIIAYIVIIAILAYIVTIPNTCPHTFAYHLTIIPAIRKHDTSNCLYCSTHISIAAYIVRCTQITVLKGGHSQDACPHPRAGFHPSHGGRRPTGRKARNLQYRQGRWRR